LQLSNFKQIKGTGQTDRQIDRWTDRQTDRWTDGVQHLMQPPRDEGCTSSMNLLLYNTLPY